MAWFDERITIENLEKMDTKYTRRYGKVKIIREKDDVPIEGEKDAIVDEKSQVIDDLKREAVDIDETIEDDDGGGKK